MGNTRISIPTSDNYFLGSIKTLTVSPDTEVIQFITRYFNNSVNEKCSFTKIENHPFYQKSDNVSVYTFDSNKNNCMFNYIQYLEEKDHLKHTYGNGIDIYFIYNDKKPDIIYEVVIGKQLIIAGPVEQNLSSKNFINWYQTISFK